MGITHATAATGTDSGDGKISKNAWNEDHVISGADFMPAGFIGARAYNSANQTCNNQVVLYDTEDFDTDGFHSTVTNTSRMTIPVGLGGSYLIMGNIYDNSGSVNAKIYKNGNQVPGAQATGATNTVVNPTAILNLAAGDYIEMYAQTGGSHTIYGSSSDGATAALTIAKLDAGRVGSGVGASVVKSALQTLTTAVEAAVQWDGTDIFDTDGFHDPSTHNTRITIPAGLAGKYLFTSTVDFASHATGLRYTRWRKNGSTDLGNFARVPAGSSNVYVSNAAVFDLAAGDYVELMAHQNSGGNLDIEAGTAWLQVMRLDSPSSGPLAATKYTRTSGNYTTSSTSFTDVDGTNLSLTITTGSRRVLLGFTTSCSQDTANRYVFLDVAIDGTRQGTTDGGLTMTKFAANEPREMTFVYMSNVLSAGSHTFKVQWKVDAGTGTMYGLGSGGYGNATHFFAQELPDSGALAASGGGSGASFPAAPSTNDRFFRTDLGLDFYYDGTRWVSVQMFRQSPSVQGSMPWSSSCSAWWRDWNGGAYDLWLDSVECLTYHSGAPMSSNYWTIALYKGTAAESETSLGSFTTSSDTSNNWTNHKVTIGATLGSTYRYVRWNGAKTSAPGAVYVVAALNYRLIAT